MQTAAIVGGQITIMFLLMAVGVIAKRKGMLTEEAARCLSTFLLNAALPCVMISSLYRPKRQELLLGFGLVFFLGVIMHGAAIILSRLLIRKREGYEMHAERFAVVYANSIYMAIPMIRAAMGEDCTFYAAAFVAVFLLFHWTHGVKELGGSFDAAKIIKNPSMLSIPIGLLLFWFQIPLPNPVLETIKLLGGLTTPLSMLIAGVFLSGLRPADLRGADMYRTAAVRVLAVPAVVMAAVMLLGCAGWFEGARYPALVAVYSFCCPSAVSVILMSASLGKDAVYPSKLVAVSTLISFVTLPLTTAIADMLIV